MSIITIIIIIIIIIIISAKLFCVSKQCCVSRNFVLFQKTFFNGKMIGIFCFLSGILLCFRHNIELCFAPVGHRIFPEDKTTTTKIITLLSSFCCRFPSLLYQEVLVPP